MVRAKRRTLRRGEASESKAPPAVERVKAFLANVVPHLVNGVSGNPFPTPFAKPPGKGLSSPTVNVLWALLNMIDGYVLLLAGKVLSGERLTLVVFFAGVAAISIMASGSFAKKEDRRQPKTWPPGTIHEKNIVPLTTIDHTAALIVIDLQKGLVATPVVHPIDGIIERSAQLARAFRDRGVPVVLVNVAGGAPGRTDVVRPKMSIAPDFTKLVPEIGQHPDDIIITRHRVGAFLGTSLDETLRQRGVTQVFLTGIATSHGVEATARSAYDLGYNLVLVTEAITGRDPEAHRYSVEKVFPRISKMDRTDNVLTHLRSRQ